MSQNQNEVNTPRIYSTHKKTVAKQRGIQQKILDFYYNEFESIIKLTNRGPILSQILIIFGTIQRMTSMFSETIMDVVNSKGQQTSDDLMAYIRLTLNYLKMYPILNSALGFQNEKEIFLFLTSFINSFIFLYVFLRASIFLYNYNNKFMNMSRDNGLQLDTLNANQQKQSSSQSKLSYVHSKMSQQVNSIFFLFDKLVSTICQVYLHTLLMPSLDISFSFIIGTAQQDSQIKNLNEQLIQVLSVFNLVMTCLIGLILSVNESDYNFSLSDYMAKRDSIANTLLLMQDITFQVLYNTTQIIAVVIVHIICLIIRLLYYCSELPYFYDPVSRLYGQITLMHFNFALILTINYVNLSFIFVTIIPLSFKAGQIMRQAITKDIILRMQGCENNQKKSFLQKVHGFKSTYQSNSVSLHSQQYAFDKQLKNLSFFSPNEIDCYVREVFKQFIQIPITQYVDSSLGFYFESIFVSHIQECKIIGCFCDEYKKSHDLTKEDFLSSEKREKFITGYINHIFTMYFHRHKNFYQFDVNRLRFSFLTFLIQVCQIPTKAYVEVISMGRFGKLFKQLFIKYFTQKHFMNRKLMFIELNLNFFEGYQIYLFLAYIINIEKNASIREKFVYYSILRKTQNTFSKYFINSSITNQKLQMIQVVEFDELVEETTILIFKALNKKYEFYQYLCQDFLNLNQLNKLGEGNIKIRNQIEKNILKIFDLNLYNKKAHCLADIYLEHFDLQRRKKKDLLLKSREAINNVRKKIKEINLGIYQIKQKLFQGNTVIVHISLLKPVGVIKRISHNFQKIFFVEPKDVLGQNINILMPKVIGQVHNRILENFIEKGDMPSIYKGERLLFGVDRDQYIFPLETRLKLDTYTDIDFGVSASLTSIQDTNFYILFDATTMIIRNVSRNFIIKTDSDINYSAINYRQGGQFKKVSSFDLSKMILHLLVFSDDINPIKDKDMFSILIYPKNDKASELIKCDRQSMDFHTFLRLAKDENFFFLFSLSFKLKNFYNSLGQSLSYIEITNMNRMKKRSERIEIINAMKHEFEFIFNQQEDKSYKNPILIEQLCYSAFSSQIQLNQTQSSIGNNYDSYTQRSGSSNNRKSQTGNQQLFLNATQEDTIEEKDYKFFDTETNGSNSNSIYKNQQALVPPQHGFQPSLWKNKDNIKNISLKLQQSDLNWQNPISKKQQQLTLNEIQGDVVSVAGLSFMDSPIIRQRKNSFDSGINSVLAQISPSHRQQINPQLSSPNKQPLKNNKNSLLISNQLNLQEDNQITKHLRRKSSEIYYTTLDKKSSNTELFEQQNPKELKLGSFSIKSLAKDIGNKDISTVFQQSSSPRKGNERDIIIPSSFQRTKEFQNKKNVSFEDQESPLRQSLSAKRKLQAFNFSYQPELTSPTRYDDDTGDNQLNSIDNKMRNHNGIGEHQNQNNFMRLKKNKIFMNKIIVKQIKKVKIKELTQKINTSRTSILIVTPKIIVEGQGKQMVGNQKEQKGIDKLQSPKKDEISLNGQVFFNTLIGDVNNTQKYKNHSFSDLVEKRQKQYEIEKVDEEKEGEGETQKIIHINDKNGKKSPLNKIQQRVSKLILQKYEARESTPQIKLNNNIDFTDYKLAKRNIKSQRIQELKNVMIHASHEYSYRNRQKSFNQLKNRADNIVNHIFNTYLLYFTFYKIIYYAIFIISPFQITLISILNVKYYNEKGRYTQSFIEEDLEKKEKDLIVDNQSIQSSQSDHNIKKSIFLDIIESKQPPQVIRTIDYFGKISIICMVIVAICSYSILKKEYEQEIQLFNEQEKCDSLLSKITDIMIYHNFGKICSKRQDWSLYNDQCKDSKQYDLIFEEKLDLLKGSLLNLVKNEFNEKFMLQYMNNNIDMRVENDEYQTSLKDLNNLKQKYVFNSMLSYFYNLKKNGDQLKPKGYDRFFYLNMEYFISIVYNLSQISFEEVRNVLLAIKDTQKLTLIILILTIFIIISMAVPMFIRVQFSRQEILQLFGTYSFQKLVDTQRQILETIIEILPLYYDFTRNEVVYKKRNYDDQQNNFNNKNTNESKIQDIQNFRMFLERLLLACEPTQDSQQQTINHQTQKYEYTEYGDKQFDNSFSDFQGTDIIPTETQQLNLSQIKQNQNQFSQRQQNQNYTQKQINKTKQNQQEEEKRNSLLSVNISNNQNIQKQRSQINFMSENQQQMQNYANELEIVKNLQGLSYTQTYPAVSLVIPPPPPTSSNKMTQQQQQLLSGLPEITGRQFQGVQNNEYEFLTRTVMPSKVNEFGQRVSLESNNILPPNTTNRSLIGEMSVSMRTQRESSTKKRVAIIQQQKKQNFLYHQILSHLNLKKSYSSNLDEMHEQAGLSFLSNSAENIKKRNISQTSVLQKVSCRLILKVTLIFAVISAFPVLNYIVSENFILQMNRNVEMLQIMNISKFSLFKQIYYQTSKWSFLLLDENKDLIEDYDKQIKNLFQINQDQLMKLYDSEKILKDNINKSFNNDTDYMSMNILFYTFEKDACKILEFSYHNSQSIKIQDCHITYMDGILQQGLIVGLQSLLSAYKSFIQDDVRINNAQQASDILYQYDQSFNIQEVLDVVEIVRVIYNQLRGFLYEYTSKFYSDKTELQNNLILSYAMIALIIGLNLFWMRFIYKTSQSLISTKNLLGILSISLLVENRYIYSYLNKQTKSKS